MKKKLYTIGKVAELMGIQTQLLRYYCDMGLVTPEYTDPDSGYRYFSYEQFPYIDRTRFLLQCGLSLKKIKDVLVHDNIPLLVELLEQEKIKKEEELERIQGSIDTIEWYLKYYAYNHDAHTGESFHIKNLEKRYLFAVKCPESYQSEDFYLLFNRIKNEPRYRHLKLTRQITVILEADSFMNNGFKRQYVGKFVLEDPMIRSEHILEIPAGNYYCFHTEIFNSSWLSPKIQEFVKEKGTPRLMLANEYEASLANYNNNPHELQILMGG